MWRIKAFKCSAKTIEDATAIIDGGSILCGRFNTAAEAVSAAFTLCERHGADYLDCEVEREEGDNAG